MDLSLCAILGGGLKTFLDHNVYRNKRKHQIWSIKRTSGTMLQYGFNMIEYEYVLKNYVEFSVMWFANKVVFCRMITKLNYEYIFGSHHVLFNTCQVLKALCH